MKGIDKWICHLFPEPNTVQLFLPFMYPEGIERHRPATSADTCILRRVYENPPTVITRQHKGNKRWMVCERKERCKCIVSVNSVCGPFIVSMNSNRDRNTSHDVTFKVLRKTTWYQNEVRICLL